MSIVFLIVKSKITGQYNYCPKQHAAMIRLYLDDKESGLLTIEDAKEQARRLDGAEIFEVASEESSCV